MIVNCYLRLQAKFSKDICFNQKDFFFYEKVIFNFIYQSSANVQKTILDIKFEKENAVKF